MDEGKELFMTDQEFEVILSEVKQMRKAIAGAVQQIVHQESEINALRLLLEERGLASADEIAAASHECRQELNRSLAESSNDGSLGRSATLLAKQGKRKPYLCRPGM